MDRCPAAHGVISGVLMTIVGTAKVWGQLQAKRDRAGLNVPALDDQIAAIAHLRGQVRLGEDKPGGWQAIAGQTEQDDFFEEAVRHGAEWRSKGNQEER